MTTDYKRRRGRGLRLALLCGLALTGCDLDVTPPGSVQDEDLTDPRSYLFLLTGAMGDYANAAAGLAGGGGLYGMGALLTDELVASGTRPAHRSFSDGQSLDQWTEVDELWGEASRARVTAEESARLIGAVIPDPADLRFREGTAYWAQAVVWAGFANRLMGDSFCEAAIDGGPIQPHTVFYERAEAHFTEAIRLASLIQLDTLVETAYGGRAQVRMMRGNWAGAVEDAGKVQTRTLYNQIHSTGTARQTNYFRTMGRDSLSWTVWGTPFETLGRKLGTTTGDPRVTFDTVLVNGRRALSKDNRRPFLRQTKFLGTTVANGAIPVMRGTEMRLIEAEAALVAGNVPAAVAKINELRTFRRSPPFNQALPNVSATTLAEGWVLLQRERGLELWLEGRRLPDMRRWKTTPGTAPFDVVREVGTGAPATDPRRNVLQVSGGLCVPIGRLER